MLTTLAFIFTLALLVTVHEYGHFQVAKWCGVKVLKFSIGFGKPLWTKKFGNDQTDFVISAIPLGGYVKMLDEREFEPGIAPQIHYSEPDLKRAFNRQSVTTRIAIVLAGPLANLLLAIFNLVPIPPLDGSKILFSILPNGGGAVRAFLERYGFIVVLFFVFFLWNYVSPLVYLLFQVITGVN